MRFTHCFTIQCNPFVWNWIWCWIIKDLFRNYTTYIVRSTSSCMVFSKWFTSSSKDFPSCRPFNSPGKLTVTGFDVHFTIMTTFTSVFYNVPIEVICFSGVYSSTFFTDWVVRQPVVCQWLSSVLVKNGFDFIVLFKGYSD